MVVWTPPVGSGHQPVYISPTVSLWNTSVIRKNCLIEFLITTPRSALVEVSMMEDLVNQVVKRANTSMTWDIMTSTCVAAIESIRKKDKQRT